MIQFNTLHVKLSNSLLNKLKSEMKKCYSSKSKSLNDAIAGFDGETNFPHKLLLTDTQVLRFPKLFQIVCQLI